MMTFLPSQWRPLSMMCCCAGEKGGSIVTPVMVCGLGAKAEGDPQSQAGEGDQGLPEEEDSLGGPDLNPAEDEAALPAATTPEPTGAMISPDEGTVSQDLVVCVAPEKEGFTGQNEGDVVAPEDGFFVRIDKRNTKMVVGIDLGCVKSIAIGSWNCGALNVKKVRKGLVKQWNIANSSQQVLPGDMIVQVNGVGGKYEDLLEQMAKEPVLILRLLRPSTFASPKLASENSEHK